MYNSRESWIVTMACPPLLFKAMPVPCSVESSLDQRPNPFTDLFTIHEGEQAQASTDIQSYGATVFLFKAPIRCVCEKLGGAVATYNGDERDVFEEDPAQCNLVDAIFFAGAANAGLVVGAGVAEHLCERNTTAGRAPGLHTVKGAITGSGAWGAFTSGWVYPVAAFGKRVCESHAKSVISHRQHGAGVQARVGSIDPPTDGVFNERLAGQGWFGAVSSQDEGVWCYAYINLNSKGRIVDHENRQRSLEYTDEQSNGPSMKQSYPRSTNAMVVTNVKFKSTEHMKQVARQTLASLSRVIVPFACHSDGDVLFLCSTEEVEIQKDRLSNVGLFFSETLQQAALSVFPHSDRPREYKANKIRE